MLTLITTGGSIPLKVDDYYIKELASGLDELIFSVSIWDNDYVLIQEESSIKEESNGKAALYLVKAIDAGKETALVKAQIDLDDWKSVMVVGYNSGSDTFPAIVEAVKPTGWAVDDQSGMVNARTIDMEAATPLDVLEKCRNTFNGATYRFDNVNKVITLVNSNIGENIGAFVTRDLNLKEQNYKGKSTGFATRLYAYGKDGLSFADINDGKPYVENHTYSGRVICAYWTDERYTIAQNLLADAQAKLDAMAVPQRSFDCSVVDLAATNPEKYSELDFKLFTIVGLIDQTRSGAKINHQVVERWIYPNHPEDNKIVLSTVAPRIQSQVAQIVQSINNVNSDWSQQQAAYYDALTAAILGAKGGSVRLLDTNNDGEPDTLYIADDPDPASAQMVWRFNYQGWAASTNGYNGPFVLGASFADGGTLYANVLKVLNINADNITSGTINADSINVTNINGQNIKDKTIGSNPLADSAVISRTINSGAVSTGKLADLAVSTGKLANLSVSNGKLGASAVSNGKLDGDLQGEVAQIEVNKSDIATINGYFTGGATMYSVAITAPLGLSIAGKTCQCVSLTIDGQTYNLVGWGSI